MLNTIKNTAHSLIKSGLNSISGQSNQYSADTELARAEETQKRYTDAINTQYAAGIQNLQDQQKNLALQYDPQRASVNAQYERGMRNNAEQMANLGLTRSGTNLTAMTALDTERARGMAEVNSAQDAASRQLQAQINEYIAQRDSDIAKQSASIYENAYNNISAYERQLATMEAQNKYDKEMAVLNHSFNQQMATLEHSYNLALQNNDYAQKKALETEMAALEQSYKIQALEKQAELDNASYAQRAATDWGYTQKEMALQNKYDLALQAAKANAEKKTLTGKTIAKSSDLGEEAFAIYTTYNTAMQRANSTMNTTVRKANSATALSKIQTAYNEGKISETEADWLIKLWRLN